jgi:hypothetical protein
MTQERFFELVYAWKDGDLTGDELYRRVFVLSNVSHQRELLVAFCKYLEKEGGIGFVSPEFLADDFLSNQ